MDAKLLIIGACILFAAANYALAVDNLADILETEDGIYARVFNEEAEHLRLSRQAVSTLGHLLRSHNPQNYNFPRINLGNYKFVNRDDPFKLKVDGDQKQGFSLTAEATRRLWESQNKKTSIDGTGRFTQPIFAPGGNQPRVGVDLSLTHRFNHQTSIGGAGTYSQSIGGRPNFGGGVWIKRRWG